VLYLTKQIMICGFV